MFLIYLVGQFSVFTTGYDKSSKVDKFSGIFGRECLQTIQTATNTEASSGAS